MKIAAFNRSEPSTADYKQYTSVFTTDLDKVLSVSDYVSIHLPASPETKGLFNKETFLKMKPGSVLINTARGSVIDENALYEVLKNGHLRMAALDVFQSEPCDPQNPLLQLDNVIATPHNAALTQDAMDQMGLQAAQEIDRVLNGQVPLWPVNHPQTN